MKLKKVIGYLLLAMVIGGYILILTDSPWWLLPLSIAAAAVAVAILGLIAWLIVGDE